MKSAIVNFVRRISLLLLCLSPWLCLSCWVAPLPGATLERLSLDELIQKSTAIVRAKVVGSSAEFRGSDIYTHWKVQVVERWKGASQSGFEVLVPGGSARGFHQSVPGAPALVAGKEYLLFLWTSRSGATYITGWSQGVYELSKNAAAQWMASRSAASENMLDRGTWRRVKDEGVQMPYSEMTSHISAGLSPALSQVRGGR
jgi:hypothetical protein